MKTLDERISATLSLYDEVDMTQEELVTQQEFLYQQDAIIESMGTRRSRMEFDLHFDEVMEKASDEEKVLFLKRCMVKLSSIFSLDVLLDDMERNGTIENNVKDVSKFMKYFCKNEWLSDIANCIPTIDVSYLQSDANKIKDLYLANFLEIKNKIKSKSNINLYVRFYFDCTSTDQGVNTLMYMTYLDLPGLITEQLLNK